MNHEGTKAQRQMQPIPDDTEEIAREVVDAAFNVHKELGPGLLESVYEQCLAIELETRKLDIERQVEVPVVYRGLLVDAGFRLDLVVERQVVVELKAVDSILPVHAAQLLTYLRLTGHRLGFLINFNVPVIKKGIQRFAL